MRSATGTWPHTSRQLSVLRLATLSLLVSVVWRRWRRTVLTECVNRSMQTPVEDRAFQRCPSAQEQGGCEGVRQVLGGCLDGTLEGEMVDSHCILFVFLPMLRYICHAPKMITADMRLYERCERVRLSWTDNLR